MWVRVLVGLHFSHGKRYAPGDEFFTDNEDFLVQHGTEKFAEVEDKPAPETVVSPPIPKVTKGKPSRR